MFGHCSYDSPNRLAVKMRLLKHKIKKDLNHFKHFASVIVRSVISLNSRLKCGFTRFFTRFFFFLCRQLKCNYSNYTALFILAQNRMQNIIFRRVPINASIDWRSTILGIHLKCVDRSVSLEMELTPNDRNSIP